MLKQLLLSVSFHLAFVTNALASLLSTSAATQVLALASAALALVFRAVSCRRIVAEASRVFACVRRLVALSASTTVGVVEAEAWKDL